MTRMETSPSVTEASPRERRLDFEEFFLEHHESLFRALWLVTRNRHEAEEVMQDAFLRLLERWPVVEAADDPKAYLYRAAMNVFRSRLRRAAVAMRKTVHALPPDDQFAEVEARDTVVRALAPLPVRQRAALVLMDLLGLSSEEAGRALGVRAVTVRVLASRARATLREVLDEDR
jgi:RNA polymerase sigma-70 factor (ECF subfamily)